MAELAAQLGLLTNVASGVPQALVGAAAVSTVLCLEVPRRVAGVRLDLTPWQCARSAGKILVGCAPEVLGFTVVMIIAVLLRLRGDCDMMPTPLEQQVWERLKVEWPILMGADTLLNLQAMLRLLVLLFLGLRAQAGGRSPLSGLPSLLFLAGALTRGALSAASMDYRLEGPLALRGDLPIACELAGVAFWASFGRTGLRRAPATAAAMVASGMWFASHHYLNLAKDASIDRLFVQAHVLETLGAFAYAIRSFFLMVGQDDPDEQDDGKPAPKQTWRGAAFVGFMHTVMTLQQALAAYYFFTAFEPSDRLVGAGRPFCVLCISNLLQLGAFLMSFVFWAGGCVDIDFNTSGTATVAPTVMLTPTGASSMEVEQVQTEVNTQEDMEIEDDQTEPLAPLSGEATCRRESPEELSETKHEGTDEL